jgi:hypothetical protein
MQPMPHGVQIQHDLPGVLGQAAHPQVQQARLDFGWIVGHFVAAGVPVVGQLQAVERGGGGQGDATVGGMEPLGSQGIGLVASSGQQGIPSHLLVVIDILIPQSQAVDALRQHLAHRVFDPGLVALVRKA